MGERRFRLLAPSVPVAPSAKYLHNLWLWIGPLLGKLIQAWQGRRTARERLELTGISGADGEHSGEGAGGDGADVAGFNSGIQILFLDPRELLYLNGKDQATGILVPPRDPEAAFWTAPPPRARSQP